MKEPLCFKMQKNRPSIEFLFGVFVLKFSFLCVLFYGATTGLNAQKSSIAEQLKILVLKNLKYSQGENMEKMMGTIHKKSPFYDTTRTQVKAVFSIYDLKYTLLAFKYIALDGEFAFARLKQRSDKVSGPAFRNNETEILQVYRKEKEQWKIWSQAILKIKFLN